jgi:hypothetical protein
MPQTIEAEVIETASVRQVQDSTALAPVPSNAMTPMNLLEQAVASGNLDMAAKMMDLHERWEKNQARKAFDEAIAAAKAKIPPIIKNREGHNSKYADFAALARVVDPIISSFGLSYRFRTVQNGTINVTCILSHRAGHSEENTLSGPADNSGSKNAIQAIGSTLTYLQRYSLTQALGLAASQDDDGKSANSGDPITDEQLEELSKMIAETKSNINLFCKAMKVECLSDIPASRFDEAIVKLKAKAAKLAGAAQ